MEQSRSYRWMTFPNLSPVEEEQRGKTGEKERIDPLSQARPTPSAIFKSGKSIFGAALELIRAVRPASLGVLTT